MGSTTDPEARFYRKGPRKKVNLCFMGHALMENPNGLVVDACLTEANGHADRVRPITLGSDKAYDAEDFVRGFRQ